MPTHSFFKLTKGKLLYGPLFVPWGCQGHARARELALVGQKLKTALSDRKMISPSSALFTEGGREGAVADAVLLKRRNGVPECR